jgi:transcription termination/antitermination protein NusG
MFRWYVINTYSGHENKVKHNLEHRVQTMGQDRKVRQVVVPTEEVSEIKDGKKVNVSKRTMPGYVLVQMEMTDDAWGLVKNTPGVTGFVGSRNKPLPLSAAEVDNLLHTAEPEPAPTGASVSGGPGAQPQPKPRAQFEIGETVKVISGPLSDFSGEIAEINDDAAKLKVLVSIFGRETPVEVGYDQVKKA